MGAERAKSQQETENEKLSVLIKKHEELIPSVQKTSVMVDLYWKCYAYGDELKPILSSLTESCFLPPVTLLPPVWRMSMSSLRGRRSPLSSLIPRRTSLLISLPRVRLSWSILTSPSSLRAMSRGSRRAGMTPRRPGLAMLRTTRPLPLSLRLPRRRSSWSRRGRTCTTRATIPSVDFSRPLTTTSHACPSLSQKTRRRLWTRRSRLLRPSSRLSDASRTLLKLLRTSALPLLTLTTP